MQLFTAIGTSSHCPLEKSGKERVCSFDGHAVLMGGCYNSSKKISILLKTKGMTLSTDTPKMSPAEPCPQAARSEL